MPCRRRRGAEERPKHTKGVTARQGSAMVDSVSLPLSPFQGLTSAAVFCSDSGRGSSLLDRTIADRRQLNTITLPDFSDPETGENNRPEGTERCPRARGAGPEWRVAWDEDCQGRGSEMLLALRA